jgi:hypothetical protein
LRANESAMKEDRIEVSNAIANNLAATLIVPEGFRGLAFSKFPDEDESGTIKSSKIRSKPPSAQDVLKACSSEPSIRPPPERSASKNNNTIGSTNELQHSTASSSSSPPSSPSPVLTSSRMQTPALPSISFVPINSIIRSQSFSNMAGFRQTTLEGQIVVGTGGGKGFTAPQPSQQLPQSPLIDLGFFDVKFRDALKEFFISSNMPKMCPWIDIIIDITKFKCIFEGNMPIPKKDELTADIYRMVNTRAKKKVRTAKARVLHESDPRFADAKSRAQKLLAKYRATNSPNQLPLTGKYREKACCFLLLSRPITNRINQSFFDKVQQLAWQTLEAELPRFIPSVERLCYEEHKGLTHDIMRIEHKLMEVDTSMNNKQSEIQILQQQKITLSNLHTAKLLATKRHRPKATYLCGFENFQLMMKYWETVPQRHFEYSIPNDLVCYIRGEAGNEKEITFGDIACGRLTSTYPSTDSKVRLGDPICDTFRLYLTQAYPLFIKTHLDPTKKKGEKKKTKKLYQQPTNQKTKKKKTRITNSTHANWHLKTQ